jgi:hypothetical protein
MISELAMNVSVQAMVKAEAEAQKRREVLPAKKSW